MTKASPVRSSWAKSSESHPKCSWPGAQTPTKTSCRSPEVAEERRKARATTKLLEQENGS
eukprot:8083258-Alexandrium_andersonii.AAC.1